MLAPLVVRLEVAVVALPLLLRLVASQLFGLLVVVVAPPLVLLDARVSGPLVAVVAGRLDVAAGLRCEDAVARVGVATPDALAGVVLVVAETPHVGAVVARAHLAVTDVAEAPVAVALEILPAPGVHALGHQCVAEARPVHAIGRRAAAPVDDGRAGAPTVGEAAHLEIIGHWWVYLRARNQSPTRPFSYSMT